MDAQLRKECLQIFEACLTQIRSGSPGPSLLTSREFYATLESLCKRLENSHDEDRFVQQESNNDSVIHFIVSAGSAAGQEGLSSLKKWLSGADEVTVCDPYLFHFQPTEMFPNVESYARALRGLIPNSVKKLDLYSNGFTRVVRSEISRHLKEGRMIRYFSSAHLHDRFIIKGGTEGKIIGTSFGGFGNKFFAMLDLPRADVNEVLNHLRALCPATMYARRPI
jgi:hypothetical protein